MVSHIELRLYEKNSIYILYIISNNNKIGYKPIDVIIYIVIDI